jgi:hypothetical protein
MGFSSLGEESGKVASPEASSSGCGVSRKETKIKTDTVEEGLINVCFSIAQLQTHLYMKNRASFDDVQRHSFQGLGLFVKELYPGSLWVWQGTWIYTTNWI